jgi:hypothetical protein
MKNKIHLVKMITLIGSFISIASAMLSIQQILQGNSKISYITLVAVVVILIALFFVNTHHYHSEVDRKFKITHRCLHDYGHLLRDTTYRIIEHSKHGCNDLEMHECLYSFSVKCVEILQRALSALTGVEANSDSLVVCIKRLEYQFWDNAKTSDLKSLEYTTLYRSINAGGERQRDDELWHKVTDCREFYKILIDAWPDWIGLNLKQKNTKELSTYGTGGEEITYTNPCKVWNKYYNNVIAVPIRIKKFIKNPLLRESADRNLLAFLCVEYRDSKIISKKEIDVYCDFLKTFADSMYTIFDSIYDNMSCSKSE